MRRTPCRLADVADMIPEQQGLQLMAGASPCLDDVVPRSQQIATNGAHVAHFTVAPCFGYRNVNGILVHIQSDIQSARLFHGLPPVHG